MNASTEEIDDQLQRWGVDTTIWPAKCQAIQKLALEIERGECFLDEQSRMRHLRIARIKIIDALGAVLIEHGLIDESGFRYRGRLPAEKCLPKEEPLDTALRGISEELGIGLVDTVTISSGRPQIEIADSASYPQLRSRYEIYDICFESDRLPSCNFWTRERAEGFEKIHLWTWRPTSQ